jgi:Flp pilus assembly protein TadG
MLTRTLSAFSRNDRGNIAVIFCCALTTIMVGSGAAIDYSRASNARTSLQGALDAAVLMAGKDALATGKKATNDSVMQNVQHNLDGAHKEMAISVSLTQSSSQLQVTAKGSIKASFGVILGRPILDIAAAASVPLGSSRLEIALVLDTTGSMGQLGKMNALKQAATELVDTVFAARKGGTEVAFAVVPFNTQVRVDTSYATADWMTFKDTDPNPKKNADPMTWTGCIMDRDQPNNKKTKKPDKLKKDELHPGQACATGNLQTIMSMTDNSWAIKGKINSLVPDGNTNTTIGMAWGYNVMKPGNPMSAGASTSSIPPIRAMVFLTDGLNTEDGHGNPTATIDADTREICTDGKATSGIRVFTIRVIDGNDALLQDCASSPGDFYKVNDTQGLKDAFKAIAGKLMTLRLSS